VGRGFESLLARHSLVVGVPIAQGVRGLHAVSDRREPLGTSSCCLSDRAEKIALVAQLAEQRTLNPQVEGSTPSECIRLRSHAAFGLACIARPIVFSCRERVDRARDERQCGGTPAAIVASIRESVGLARQAIIDHTGGTGLFRRCGTRVLTVALSTVRRQAHWRLSRMFFRIYGLRRA
jgi:hypothetical protein